MTTMDTLSHLSAGHLAIGEYKKSAVRAHSGHILGRKTDCPIISASRARRFICEDGLADLLMLLRCAQRWPNCDPPHGNLFQHRE
jgi:hypothetical protein